MGLNRNLHKAGFQSTVGWFKVSRWMVHSVLALLFKLVNVREVVVCCDSSTTMCDHQWGKAGCMPDRTLHASKFTMVH